jgi:hypothetical protein
MSPHFYWAWMMTFPISATFVKSSLYGSNQARYMAMRIPQGRYWSGMIQWSQRRAAALCGPHKLPNTCSIKKTNVLSSKTRYSCKAPRLVNGAHTELELQISWPYPVTTSKKTMWQSGQTQIKTTRSKSSSVSNVGNHSITCSHSINTQRQNLTRAGDARKKDAGRLTHGVIR